MTTYWQAMLKTTIGSPSISTSFLSLLNDKNSFQFVYDKRGCMSSGELFLKRRVFSTIAKDGLFDSIFGRQVRRGEASSSKDK
jgi:hypothetical protein